MFEEGDFENASIAFSRAYELRPSYKILYNVGQVESTLKRYTRALDAYNQYLEQGGSDVSAERAAEVQAQIDRLKMLVGSVELAYSQNGVTVLIDGERRGITPLDGPIWVDMGSHELSLRKGITEIYRENFRIAGGQSLTLVLDTGDEPRAASVVPAPAVEKEPEPPPSPSTEEVAPPDETPVEEASDGAPKEAPKKKKRVWTWVAWGVGGAAAIAGGIVGGVSMSKESKLKERCPDGLCSHDDKDEAKTIKNMNGSADLLYGVAAVFGVTGLILFFVEPKRASREKASARPTLAPSTAGVGVEGRF
jgi:hypothetical protein